MNYVITHTDLDGLGCAVLFEKVFPGEVSIFSTDYREANQLIPVVLAKAGNSNVFITDISLNEEMAAICDKYGKVNHIDHHSSSKWLSDKYPWSFTDVTHCATYHTYQMLKKFAILDDYEEFVNLVDNYDTWGHGTQPSEKALELNTLLSMIGSEAFVLRFKVKSDVTFSEAEKALIAADAYQRQEYCKLALEKVTALRDNQGNNFLMIAAEQYTSSLGNYLLQQFPEAEYVVIIDSFNDKASLRSRGNVDVGELAKACGGGGHKKAAGFVMNETALRAFWRCGYCEYREQWERRQSGNTNLDHEVSGNG